MSQPLRVLPALLGILLAAGRASATEPKLAVMEIQDQTRALPGPLLESLTDSLRTQLARSGRYLVIDKSRQATALRRLITQQKTESYKSCYDSRCQIPLGQALAADSLLRTKIIRIGSHYLGIAELVDLEKEAVTGAAQAQVAVHPARGRDDRLLQLVVAVARQLTHATAGETGAPAGSGLGGGDAGGSAGVTRPLGSDSVERGSGVDTATPRDSARLGGLYLPPSKTSPQALRQRQEHLGQARLERERRARENEERRAAAHLQDEVRRKRAVRLTYGWMGAIGGAILGGTGLYYIFGKAAGAQDKANQATTPSALKQAADEVHSDRVTGGVLIGLGGAALAGGLVLIFTAPKLVRPARVAGLELDRLPSGGPTKRGLVVRWGGSF